MMISSYSLSNETYLASDFYAANVTTASCFMSDGSNWFHALGSAPRAASWPPGAAHSGEVGRSRDISFLGEINEILALNE